MSLQFLPVILFLLGLACLPFLIRWLKSRIPQPLHLVSAQNKVISAVAVGPHQRVVTVEVGPSNDRVWLTLGVTTNGIQCLHSSAAPAADSAGEVI